MKTLYILILILVIVFAGIFAIDYLNKNKIVACTEDARICPDGTAVARVPPDCEFAPCPNKECEIDSDCVVFGEDGDCNCGCYNKDFLPQNTGGECFCAAPTSCECVDGECQGVFEQIIGGETDEHGCMLMAGYTWNETKQECVREWEEILKDSCIELGCPENSLFVGSKNSDKYYNCNCGWAKTISPENLVCFATDAEAVADERTKSEC